MSPITVKRYVPPLANGWLGTVEPKNGRWVLFVWSDTKATLFQRRDPATGAVTELDS
jgi:hypothetical protein